MRHKSCLGSTKTIPLGGVHWWHLCGVVDRPHNALAGPFHQFVLPVLENEPVSLHIRVMLESLHAVRNAKELCKFSSLHRQSISTFPI